MDEPRLRLWEPLFRHALDIIDAVAGAAPDLTGWSFGGGTVLMRRYQHRVSKDVDIFVPDAQWLGYLTPRLNVVAEGKTADYLEQASFLKLYFPEGEIDFVVAAPVTRTPFTVETIMGRPVLVESSAEIIGKKIRHRAGAFTARDLLDLSLVAEREPDVIQALTGVLRKGRMLVMQRLDERATALREDFAALDVLAYTPSFDECVDRVRALLDRVGPQPKKRCPRRIG